MKHHDTRQSPPSAAQTANHPPSAVDPEACHKLLITETVNFGLFCARHR